MKSSGKTASWAPFEAVSAISRQALATVASRSSTTGSACTAATLTVRGSDMVPPLETSGRIGPACSHRASAVSRGLSNPHGTGERRPHARPGVNPEGVAALPEHEARDRAAEELAAGPPLDELEADQGGGEQVEGLEDVGASLVAHGETAVAAEPGQRAFRHPAVPAQPLGA